ncbi:unnamed protein product [marine sediment metagenome]|uniref:Uncharacterized protein n=1 Tax=marine sediment metagenome TaxID=412755 RepID=X1AN22_9ZZZZ
MANKNFPTSLFDERLRLTPFDIGDTNSTDVSVGDTGFVGEPNPDYDPDYISPDDSIPF